MKVTSHVVQNAERRSSALDGRTSTLIAPQLMAGATGKDEDADSTSWLSQMPLRAQLIDATGEESDTGSE